MTTTMMHRVIGPCIAIALLFLIITACGETETEPAAPASQPAAAVATQQPACRTCCRSRRGYANSCNPGDGSHE